MSKKKTTTVIEEEALETPSEINYTEDIKDKSMAEVATSEPEVKEPTKPDQVETEDKAVEVAPEEPPAPVIDPEQLKKEVAEETTQKIVEALRGQDKTQTDDNLNTYQKFAKDIWDKEGRNPTWDEVLPLIEEAAVQRLEAKQQQQIQAEDEARSKQEETQKAELDKFNNELTEGLNDLYRSGQLPKIKTPYPDESLDRSSDEWKQQEAQFKADPAYKEREALYQTMASVNTKRVADGLAPIRDIVRIYSIYHKPTNKQPAGADAAIINGRASTGASDEDNYSYKEIHTKGWQSFLPFKK